MDATQRSRPAPHVALFLIASSALRQQACTRARHTVHRSLTRAELLAHHQRDSVELERFPPFSPSFTGRTVVPCPPEP